MSKLLAVLPWTHGRDFYVLPTLRGIAVVGADRAVPPPEVLRFNHPDYEGRLGASTYVRLTTTVIGKRVVPSRFKQDENYVSDIRVTTYRYAHEGAEDVDNSVRLLPPIPPPPVEPKPSENAAKRRRRTVK